MLQHLKHTMQFDFCKSCSSSFGDGALGNLKNEVNSYCHICQEF